MTTRTVMVLFNIMTGVMLLTVFALISVQIIKELRDVSADSHAIMLEYIDTNMQLDVAIEIIESVKNTNARQAMRIADLEATCK